MQLHTDIKVKEIEIEYERSCDPVIQTLKADMDIKQTISFSYEMKR